MNESSGREPEIERLFETAEVPDSSTAMAECEREASEYVKGRRTRRGRRRLLGLGAVLALALGPPGQSLADVVGDIVSPGEPATLEQDEFGSMIERDPALVLASGRAPGGEAFEITVARALFPDRKPDMPGGVGGEQTCLHLDIPATPEFSTVEWCLTDEDWPDGRPTGIDGVNYGEGAGLISPESRYAVTAIAGDEIASAEASYIDSDGERVTVPATVAHLDDAIRERIGTDDHGGVLVAFLPDDGRPGYLFRDGGTGVLETLELIGYDAAGDVIKRDAFGKRFSSDFDDARHAVWREGAIQSAIGKYREKAEAGKELRVGEWQGLYTSAIPGDRELAEEYARASDEITMYGEE